MSSKDKILAFIWVVILGALLVVFFIKTQSNNNITKQEILDDLAALENHNASIHNIIQHLQQGTVKNYDQVFRPVNKMESVFQHLRKNKYQAVLLDNQGVDKLIDQLGGEVRQFKSALNRYLSAHAARSSLLINLASLVNKFPAKTSSNHLNKEAHPVHRFFEETLFYSRYPETGRRAVITRLGNQLTQSELQTSLSLNTESIALIILQARVAMQYTDIANGELETILSSQINKTISLIRNKFL